MKKHLLFLLLVLFSAFALNAQTTVIEAKQVKAVDSLKLKTDWITNIIKDSSLSGATVRNFPSTDAVVKYIANRLAHTVKYTDTAAIISGYVRELRFLDSLSAVQTRIQGKLTKSDADTYYPAIQRMIDSLTAVQTRIQDKLTKSDADTYYPAIQRMNDSLSAVQTRIQGKLTKSDADTYYPAIQRMNDSLTDVQTRIQDKLTKSDADTYYPAIQRMIDSLTAVQTRIQGKLTKSDADTYYPAIQRMIDSLSAVQTRIQGKLTKSDADTYYPAIQRVLDSLTAMQSRIQTKQPLLGYTAENSANKATDFSTVNNVLYPTVQAVSTYIQSALTGVLKDRGNYDASGNTFPASGGSGSGGAIKTGDMWYISVGGTLGGKAVTAGAWVRSLTDAPGQTAGNWAIADGGFGFVPENIANKSTNTSLGTSNTAYPSQNAVKTYVDNATANASNWNTAYNKRPSSASISSSTFTLTLGDGTTVTASIPTFNQNTTGNAATATNSTQWNAQEYNQTNYTTGSVTGMMIYNFTQGKWQYAANSYIQSFLGLGSYAYRSSGLAELSGADFTGTLSNSGMSAWTSGTRYFVSADAGTARLRYNTLSDLQSYLGLGSNAYTSTSYLPLTGGIVNGVTVIKNTVQNVSLTLQNNSTNSYLPTIGFANGDASGYYSYIQANKNGSTSLDLYANAFNFININTASTLFSISNSGVATATSFSGAGTGLTGDASSLTAGYLISRYFSPATDANTIWQGGMYSFFNGTNVPGGDFGMISIPTFASNTSSNRYNLQIGSNISGNPQYRTTDINGAGTWYTLLSTSNYTSYAMAGAGYSANQNLNTTSNVTFGRVIGSTFSDNTTTVSSAYTVADNIGTVFCDSHTYTVTLPSASSFPGREITIKRISSGVGTGITISGVTLGSSELGGSLGCHGAAVYKSNGTNWYCITYRTGGCD